MIKTPGRKPQSRVPSSSRKNQLSSDAKIIIPLIKEQPQTKEEICKETKISDRTFYRIISLLEEQKK
jgi:DNA invertase Pin-like site-specific DNA recombinase